MSPEQLRLAAFLGERPAQEALGESGESWLRRLVDRLRRRATGLAGSELEDAVWMLELGQHGVEAQRRALVAAASRALPLWQGRRSSDHRPRRAIEAAVAYLRDPDPRRGDAALERARSSLRAAQVFDDPAGEPAAWAAYLAGAAACACHPGPSGLAEWHGFSGELAALGAGLARVEGMTEALGEEAEEFLLGGTAAVQALGGEACRAAIREALVPWACGDGDPLAPG